MDTAPEYVHHHKSKNTIFLGNLALVLILMLGLNSVAYADQKLKHKEYRFETSWNGVQYLVLVPESQYIYDTADEVKQVECVAISKQVKEMCLCPEGVERVRYALLPNQNCSTGDYYSTYLAGIESIYCSGDFPYAQPEGTCSATPYEQPIPIAQSAKNFGSGADCPSPYVID